MQLKCLLLEPRDAASYAVMEWKKKGIELPDGWHHAVAQRAKSLRSDKRGLGRYVWATAAYLILSMDTDDLRAWANVVRQLSEADPESFAAIPDAGIVIDDSKTKRRKRGASAAIHHAVEELERAAERALQKREAMRQAGRSS